MAELLLKNKKSITWKFWLGKVLETNSRQADTLSQNDIIYLQKRFTECKSPTAISL